MKRITIFLAAGLGLLGGCRQEVQTVHPQRKALTEAVYASGNLFPRNEYKVSANADGFLVKRSVNPGDSVTPGSEMFRIDDQLQADRFTTLEQVYGKAKENYGDRSAPLTEASKAVQSAYEKQKFDSVNFVRYRDLYENNAISKAQYDQVTLQYKLSANEYKARQESLRRLRNQFFVEMQNAENNYRMAEKELSNTSVKSNIYGMVYDVMKEQGEGVRRGEILAIVGASNEVFLKLQVDEQDIEMVKTGMEVLVKLDIAPGKTYHATVTKVYPRLNGLDQSFRVDAAFTGEQPGAFYGVTAEANIIVSKKNNVLCIPKTSISGGDSVKVLRNGEVVPVWIKRGIEGTDEVEVLEGLKETDEIVTR